MTRQFHLALTPTQQAELEHLSRHAPQPYLRERAAALLKVAAGRSIQTVAQQGLLRPRQPETVRDWIARYLAAGVPGLRVRAGRGRKPAFSPPDTPPSRRRHPGASGGGPTPPTV